MASSLRKKPISVWMKLSAIHTNKTRLESEIDSKYTVNHWENEESICTDTPQKSSQIKYTLGFKKKKKEEENLFELLS